MKAQISKSIASVVAATALLLGARALAHEGHDHGPGDKVKGTVKTLTDKLMVVTTSDGKDVSLEVVEMTKFERSGMATNVSDIAVGEKVVVTMMMKGGPSGAHAMLVKLGKKSGAKSQAPSADAGMKQPSDAGRHEGHNHDGH